jgi:hypothetical protein
MNGSVTKKKNLYLFLVSFNYRYVHFEYTLIIQNELLKLQQLKCMIRVYINYEVKLNDCGLCAGIISRSKFRKTT